MERRKYGNQKASHEKRKNHSVSQDKTFAHYDLKSQPLTLTEPKMVSAKDFLKKKKARF